MENLKLWKKFLEAVKPNLSTANYKTFFSQTILKSVDKEKIVLMVPSAFIKETLNQRHLKLITDTFEKLIGEKVRVEFLVTAIREVKEEEEESFFQPVDAKTLFLNPKFTLENFVVGPTNNLAYAAAQAVAQNPGKSYNPLFIYGGTGVGKTHLMIGIGNAIAKKHPHYKINFCSSEKFTNDYVEALQTKQFGLFRTRYRTVDVLLIDDIQFFSGREGTQEEFFHTFNELASKNAQIVITSDRPPFEIAKLEDRLKSRFQGGLMIDIQIPDFDTRVAILKNKCQEHGSFLSESCLNLIAASVETNARDLEGKLIQILQSLKTKNLPATEESIRNLLGKKEDAQIKDLTPKQVVIKICQYFNLRQIDLVGPKRQKDLILPRHLTMYILAEEMGVTVEKIGELLGGRDHTTVMHGRDKMKRMIQIDRDLQRIFGEVKQSLSTI